MHSMCIAFLFINVVSNNFCMFCSQCFSFTVVVVIVFKHMAWVNSSCLLADVTCTYIFIRCTQSCCSFMCLSLFRGKSCGSGSFVTDGKQFFLLTCCHIFKNTNFQEKLQAMSPDELKRQVTTNCLNARYWVSDKNTFEIKDRPASDVLTLDGDKPHLHFDQVGVDAAVCGVI